MMKWDNSMTKKLTAGFLVLIVVISTLSFFYTCGETKYALKETKLDELTALASVIATQVDGDVLASLQEGDEDTPEFIAMRDQLYRIQESTDEISGVYLLRKDGDGIVIVVDAEYGIMEDALAINTAYKSPSEELFVGFERPISEKDFGVFEDGIFAVAYAPVFNSDGETVGIVGSEMNCEKVIDRQDLIGCILSAIMLISVLITGVFFALLGWSMNRDEETKNNENK